MNFYYENENKKDENIENNIKSILNSNKQYEILDVFNEILNENYDVEIYDESNNELIIYDVDDYDVDELIDDLFKYEIIYNDQYHNEIIIKIDDDEFNKKSIIESYDDLIKYIKHDHLIDDLIENSIEYKYIINNTIGMNLMNDFYYKRYYHYKKFINLWNLNNYDEYVELLYKFKKIVDDEFIDDVELIPYIKNDELIDDIELYENYDIELWNEFNIIINHSNKTIKNIDDVYNLIGSIINKYLKLNSHEILYDELIELINIMNKKEYQIINYDDELYKIIFYDEIDDVDELIDDFKYYYDSYELNKFENKYDILIECIDYDDIINIFDVDEFIEFIDDHVEIDYDYYDYENYVELNNIFYAIIKKYYKE